MLGPMDTESTTRDSMREALPETQSLHRFFGGHQSSQSEIQLQQRGPTSSGTTTMRRSEEASLPLHTRVSEESELRWYEVASAGDGGISTASLTPSCFSLVLVCALRGVSLWMPMMLITPICVLQFSVSWLRLMRLVRLVR